MEANYFTQKSTDVFSCEKCNFKCSKKNDWTRHLGTRKHKNANNANYFTQKNACDHCGIEFKHASSLSRHKKNCKVNVEEKQTNNVNNIVIHNEDKQLHEYIDKNITMLTNLIVEVVKNNNEFQKQMFETIKATTNITNNNMNNCNNQTFNLQLFLNETCKDAMNMSDFINSFNLQMDDLERLADDGYVKTMSNLIINKVRELDVEKRPIHCSDEKRETIYIKEDNVWIKDDENKSHLRKAVNKVGCRNIGVLQDWQQAHPNCIKSNSPYNDMYLKMMREVMGGKDTTGNENKVMKNIIKEVVIDKQQYKGNWTPFDPLLN